MKVFYYFIFFICLFNKYNSTIIYFSNLCFNYPNSNKKIFELNFYNQNKFKNIKNFKSTNNIYLIENLLKIDNNVENYENLIIIFNSQKYFKYLYKINKFNYIIIPHNLIAYLVLLPNNFYLFTINDINELYLNIKFYKHKNATINFFEKNLINGNNILYYNLYLSFILFVILNLLIKSFEYENTYNYFFYKIIKNLNNFIMFLVCYNYIQNFIDVKNYDSSFNLIYSLYKSYILSLFIFIVLGNNIIYFNSIKLHFKTIFIIFSLIENFFEFFLIFLNRYENSFEIFFRTIKHLIEYFSLLFIIIYSFFTIYLLLKKFHKFNKNFNFNYLKVIEFKLILLKKFLFISLIYCFIGIFEVFNQILLKKFFYFNNKNIIKNINLSFVLNKDFIFIFYIIKIFYIKNYPEMYFDELNLNFSSEKFFYLKLNSKNNNIINENNLNNIKNNKNNPLIIINPNFQKEIFNTIKIGYINEQNEKKTKKNSKIKNFDYIALEIEEIN